MKKIKAKNKPSTTKASAPCYISMRNQELQLQSMVGQLAAAANMTPEEFAALEPKRLSNKECEKRLRAAVEVLQLYRQELAACFQLPEVKAARNYSSKHVRISDEELMIKTSLN